MDIDAKSIIAESRKCASETQLIGISKPGANDVLCGRGGGSQNHVGNKEYRAVISANKRSYIDSNRKSKGMIVHSIVNAVRLQNPPGRFLEKDSGSGLWNDIGDKRAFAKTCQAIREGAPKIRQEMNKMRTSEKKVSSTRRRLNTEDSECSSTSLVAAKFTKEVKLTNSSHNDGKESVTSPTAAKASPSSSKAPSSGFNWIFDVFSSSNSQEVENTNPQSVGLDNVDTNVVTPHNSGRSLLQSGRSLLESGRSLLDEKVDMDMLILEDLDPLDVGDYTVEENEVMNSPLMEFSHSYAPEVSLDSAIHGSDPFEDVNDICLVKEDIEQSFDENITRNMFLNLSQI